MKKLFNKENINEQVFIENEIKANCFVAKFLLICAACLAAIGVLNFVGVLEIGEEYVLRIFSVGLIMLIVPAIICLALKGNGRWIKYMLMISFILTLSYLDMILIFNVTLLIVMPVVFSCWYYSGRFTIGVAAMTTIVFAISAYFGAYINIDNPDMNFAAADTAEYIQNVMLLSFLPRWLIFLVIFAASYVIAILGRKMVFEQAQISSANAKVETELEMAKRIQTESLPDARELDKCTCREFDLAAKMMPAREVGGDFYDFFYLDETHLALIIADVADKGIGASLYMMMSKLMLDNKLSICAEPSQVLEDVNNQLQRKSVRGMFVTVWIGILDLETGEIVTANAGHEYPAIRRAGGEFEIFKDKHGFVLGAIDGITYRETGFKLNEGDTLFVYTDGVPEANDKDGRFYGAERMIESLNRYRDQSAEELIIGVKTDIDKFANGAAQFDDTTMLAIRFLAPLEKTDALGEARE